MHKRRLPEANQDCEAWFSARDGPLGVHRISSAARTSRRQRNPLFGQIRGFPGRLGSARKNLKSCSVLAQTASMRQEIDCRMQS